MQNTGNSLIIVEDEPIISIMIEDLATDMGWKIDGSATNEADAFRLLGSCAPKIAVLDINLGLETSLGVAASCRDRSIAVIFMTGYSTRDVAKLCGDAPILEKPFSPRDFAQAVDRALGAMHMPA